MSLNNHQPPSNRVPGNTIKSKDHALNKDLTKLSKRELLDLISRQKKLLENKSRLLKLPDKGQKIQELFDRAVKALTMKDEIDCAAKLLSSLNLGTNDVNNLEWRDSTKKCQQEGLDSDDDEDPLAILTSSNSSNQNQRVVKNVQENENENTLITEEDIREAKEISKAHLKLDPVLEQVCQNENMEQAFRFLPYKSTSNSLNSSKTSLNPEAPKKERDNSAATPPVHNQGVKMLTLRESIEVESIYNSKMKELQEKQAVERLAVKMKELGSTTPLQATLKPQTTPEASIMNKYRLAESLLGDFDDEANDSLSDDEDNDDDV